MVVLSLPVTYPFIASVLVILFPELDVTSWSNPNNPIPSGSLNATRLNNHVECVCEVFSLHPEPTGFTPDMISSRRLQSAGDLRVKHV